MEPKVSERITAIADLVPRDAVLCDIGCDHGLLPVYLLKRGIIKRAIAMDVNPGPLKTARENAKRYGVEDLIDIRLSNGFDAISPNEADCFVIAGMGGILMEDILSRGEYVWKEGKTLILSPHRDEEMIRSHIGSRCFFDTDVYVFCEGHFYTAMRFLPQSPAVPLSEGERLYGKNPSEAYIEHRIRMLKKRLDELKSAIYKDDIIEKIRITEDTIKCLKGAI